MTRHIRPLVTVTVGLLLLGGCTAAPPTRAVTPVTPATPAVSSAPTATSAPTTDARPSGPPAGAAAASLGGEPLGDGLTTLPGGHLAAPVGTVSSAGVTGWYATVLLDPAVTVDAAVAGYREELRSHGYVFSTADGNELVATAPATGTSVGIPSSASATKPGASSSALAARDTSVHILINSTVAGGGAPAALTVIATRGS